MPDDALRAVAELAASQHRAFTRLQAAALKFDHRRVSTAIRRGWITELAPGVLAFAGWPSTWEAAADGPVARVERTRRRVAPCRGAAARA
jgi:hypothetical protein